MKSSATSDEGHCHGVKPRSAHTLSSSALRQTRITDRGVVCLERGDSAAPAIAADRPLTLTVAFGVCLSSSCDGGRVATCSVTRSGSTLDVHSEFSWSRRLLSSCTPDCGGGLEARCSTKPLPPGTYTLRMAGETTTIEVGGAGPSVPCPDLMVK